MTYPPTGKLKIALIVLGLALVFLGAAFKEILILFGLLTLLVAHPQILENRDKPPPPVN